MAPAQSVHSGGEVKARQERSHDRPRWGVTLERASQEVDGRPSGNRCAIVSMHDVHVLQPCFSISHCIRSGAF